MPQFLFPPGGAQIDGKRRGEVTKPFYLLGFDFCNFETSILIQILKTCKNLPRRLNNLLIHVHEAQLMNF